jgi:hypothetical protein
MDQPEVLQVVQQMYRRVVQQVAQLSQRRVVQQEAQLQGPPLDLLLFPLWVPVMDLLLFPLLVQQVVGNLLLAIEVLRLNSVMSQAKFRALYPLLVQPVVPLQVPQAIHRLCYYQSYYPMTEVMVNWLSTIYR